MSGHKEILHYISMINAIYYFQLQECAEKGIFWWHRIRFTFYYYNLILHPLSAVTQSNDANLSKKSLCDLHTE